MDSVMKEQLMGAVPPELRNFELERTLQASQLLIQIKIKNPRNSGLDFKKTCFFLNPVFSDRFIANFLMNVTVK